MKNTFTIISLDGKKTQTDITVRVTITPDAG